MIKATHDDFGGIEFTNDHPFYYKERYVTFEEFVKINSKI